MDFLSIYPSPFRFWWNAIHKSWGDWLMFYVYEWFIVDTQEVFYVGKGKDHRLREISKRNRYFKRIYNKHSCAVRFVKESLTEEEAFIEEVKRIHELKAIGWARCNLTDGGEGSTGLIHSDKSKKLISRNRKGKATGEANCNYGHPMNAETRRKVSIARKGKTAGEKNPMFGIRMFEADNHFYGRKHTEESKKKISESRKGNGARYGKDNPMYGQGFKGKDNPMYGFTGLKHPNSKAYLVTYTDGGTELLHAKGCEKKFGIAFTRIRNEGGILHYNKKTPNDIYEETKVQLCQDVY